MSDALSKFADFVAATRPIINAPKPKPKPETYVDETKGPPEFTAEQRAAILRRAGLI